MTIKSNFEIESKVIERFVIKSKRDRYLSFLKNGKTREKLINDLYHSNFFTEDLFEKVTGNETKKLFENIS